MGYLKSYPQYPIDRTYTLKYTYYMKSNETKRKNEIRKHVNLYDLFGNPEDLIQALELIHRELLEINRMGTK